MRCWIGALDFNDDYCSTYISFLSILALYRPATARYLVYTCAACRISSDKLPFCQLIRLPYGFQLQYGVFHQGDPEWCHFVRAMFYIAKLGAIGVYRYFSRHDSPHGLDKHSLDLQRS